MMEHQNFDLATRLDLTMSLLKALMAGSKDSVQSASLAKYVKPCYYLLNSTAKLLLQLLPHIVLEAMLLVAEVVGEVQL
jgi:hypothetical protein